MSIYEVKIDKLVYGGDGIGKLRDGRTVFVPFTLPNETVRIELVDEKRNHVRGQLVEILKPSPQRVTPRCTHFGVCGGCHYQHIPYPFQLKLKEEIVADQFSRVGGVLRPPVKPAQAAAQPWNYRNTIQFHLSPTGKLGYQKANTNDVVEIKECFLPQPELNELWPNLDFESIPELDRVVLRQGAGNEILITLESHGQETPELNVETPVSVVHISHGQKVVLAGDDYSVMEVKGRPFVVSAGAFFQVNIPQAEALVDHVLSLLPLSPEALVMDICCGVGLFSAFIAPRVRRLIGIELSEVSCEDFAENLDEFENVELYMGPAEDVLPLIKERPDAVVVDPPRSGLEKGALDALTKIRPPTLVYVSCDPATLARDTKRLLGSGYQLKQITPFDLFPQTYHVECVAKFTCKA